MFKFSTLANHADAIRSLEIVAACSTRSLHGNELGMVHQLNIMQTGLDEHCDRCILQNSSYASATGVATFAVYEPALNHWSTTTTPSWSGLPTTLATDFAAR